MNAFLRSTPIIDWEHPEVLKLAGALRATDSDAVVVAQRSFEWVRDHIKHSQDYGLSPVTCAASEVLSIGSGFCYAKSHLLAALLRANGIPAGLCYQRLCLDDEGRRFCLHGLNAIRLPAMGWYRVDPRGNRGNIDAQFAPPVEKLAFAPTLAGEADLPEIWPDPLPVVVDTIRAHHTADGLGRNLPDLALWTHRA